MPRKPAPDEGTPPAAIPGDPSTPPLRLVYRLAELATMLGISRRTLERLRSAGRFPKPDRVVGKMPVWTPETVRRWIDSGGKGEA